MKSSYIINNGEYIIRNMVKRDVSSYLSLFNYDILTKNKYYRIYKDILENQREDNDDGFFVVLKDGKIIGEIAAKALEDSACDAAVRITLPVNGGEREAVENLFIELCIETYIYDDIYIIEENGMHKKILISESTRRKTS